MNNVSDDRGGCGAEIELRSFAGARVVRIIHGGRSAGREHSHDWPILSLYLMGDYDKVYDGDQVNMCGPSAVFHPPGAVHANRIGEVGLEQLDIEFEPSWLASSGTALSLDRVRCWTKGSVASAARKFARMLNSDTYSEQELALATGSFLEFAAVADGEPAPSWLGQVAKALQSEEPPSTIELARRLDLNPAWLARVYRASAGEGIHETLHRKRVERAAALLRQSRLPAAAVAAAAGFCDQSHMNRCFRRLLGRTPLQVRAELFV